MEKSPEAFRTISEVSELLDTPAHVLRFWESRFPQVRPVKRAGGRRYYRPTDVALLSGIKRLLHGDGLTIRGVQKVLREHGIRHVMAMADDTLSVANATVEAEVEKPAAEAPADQPKADILILGTARPAGDPASSATEPESAFGAGRTPPPRAEPAPDVTGPSISADAPPDQAETVAAGHTPLPLASDEVEDLWVPTLLRGLSREKAATRQAEFAALHERLGRLHARLAGKIAESGR